MGSTFDTKEIIAWIRKLPSSVWQDKPFAAWTEKYCDINLSSEEKITDSIVDLYLWARQSPQVDYDLFIEFERSIGINSQLSLDRSLSKKLSSTEREVLKADVVKNITIPIGYVCLLNSFKDLPPRTTPTPPPIEENRQDASGQ